MTGPLSPFVPDWIREITGDDDSPTSVAQVIENVDTAMNIWIEQGEMLRERLEDLRRFIVAHGIMENRNGGSDSGPGDTNGD